MEKNTIFLSLSVMAVMWIGIYVIAYILIWKQCYEKGKLTKFLDFMCHSIVVRAAILLMVCIFPVQIRVALNNPGLINVLDTMWIGFYSCLLLCVIYKNRLVKMLAVCVNLGYCIMLFYGLLMNNAEKAPLLFLKVLMPFVNIS